MKILKDMLVVGKYGRLVPNPIQSIRDSLGESTTWKPTAWNYIQ